MLSNQVSEELTDFIEGYEKLLIFAIGNPLRGDDGAGPLLIDVLYEKLTKSDKDSDNVYLLNSESTPENHTREVRELKPSHIIIVDAVEFDTSSGEVVIIDKDIIDTLNFSTHTMPISFIINYLEETVGSKILIVGIQPKDMKVVNLVSDEVIESVDELSTKIEELI